MKGFWLSDRSCQKKKKNKVLVDQALREISMVNVLFHILIGTGLHKYTKLLSKCTIKTENSFDIKRNTVNKY